MKYKVGDKVRVKSLEWLKAHEDELIKSCVSWCGDMYDYAGEIVTINSFCATPYDGVKAYTFNEFGYKWIDLFLEDVEDNTEAELKEKYKEIFRLKEMLEMCEIPFDFSMYDSVGFQLCYPSMEEHKRVVSVIEHKYSYGSEADLLEIKGFLTKEEQDEDYDVVGNLTAEEVFERIQKHYYNIVD